jgi:hypothetical protein
MGRPTRLRNLTAHHAAVAARLKPYANAYQEPPPAASDRRPRRNRGGISGLHRALSARKAPGVKYLQDLQKKLSGSSAIGPDLLVHLCSILRLNPGWVLTGYGEPRLPEGAGEVLSPAETSAVVRRVNESDRNYWRARFARAITSSDRERAEELGTIAADAVLAELPSEDYHRPAKLAALVTFAARVAHPGRVRKLADTMSAATRILMRLDDAFLSESEAGKLRWPKYGPVEPASVLIEERLYEDVLTAANGFLVTFDPNGTEVIRQTRIAKALQTNKPKKRFRTVGS